jgi:hypothetical protein
MRWVPLAVLSGLLVAASAAAAHQPGGAEKPTFATTGAEGTFNKFDKRYMWADCEDHYPWPYDYKAKGVTISIPGKPGAGPKQLEEVLKQNPKGYTLRIDWALSDATARIDDKGKRRHVLTPAKIELVPAK